jgi:hypothetical protein
MLSTSPTKLSVTQRTVQILRAHTDPITFAAILKDLEALLAEVEAEADERPQ